MTLPASRTLAATVLALLLATPIMLAEWAVSAPPADRGKPEARTVQLLKVITAKDRQLGRVATAERTTSLGDDLEALVLTNIASDRAPLADLAARVTAGDPDLDLRAARTDLRQVRVENYVLVVNVLRRAESLLVRAPEGSDAAALARDAIGEAAEITATSPRSAIREARKAIVAAGAGLDDERAVGTRS